MPYSLGCGARRDPAWCREQAKGPTCNGSPAAEEDILGHRVVRRRAELGDHNGQHQVLGHLLPLDAVAQLQVRHIWEG